jgi:integrase
VNEARRLINACDPDFRPLVEAALATGCRYGELVRLQVEDFNCAARTLAIRTSKSGRPRHVVLTEEGEALFTRLTVGREGAAPIFVRPDGRPWAASNQIRRMVEASARATITPAVNFHALRHTWASLIVMAGAPLLVAARNLGHADTRMVEKHYGHSHRRSSPTQSERPRRALERPRPARMSARCW